MQFKQKLNSHCKKQRLKTIMLWHIKYYLTNLISLYSTFYYCLSLLLSIWDKREGDKKKQIKKKLTA